MTSPRLTAEQRLALATLAGAGRDGATQVLLSAHGFDASMIAGLVNHGLATITAERVRDGGKLSPRCGSRPQGGTLLRAKVDFATGRLGVARARDYGYCQGAQA
jgi:hypothetical protein